jgi:hypothetical protein
MRRLVVTALIWLCGCRPGAGDEGGRTDDFNARLAQVICERNVACCTTPELPLEQCKARLTNHFDALRSSRDESLESFDAGLASDCVAALSGMSCIEWVEVVEANPPAACRSYARGRLEDGERCRADLECRSHFCNANTGVCEPRGALDSACDGLQNQCAAGMSCGDGTMPGAFCGPLIKQGGACTRPASCYSASCSGGTCAPSCWYDPLRFDAF